MKEKILRLTSIRRLYGRSTETEGENPSILIAQSTITATKMLKLLGQPSAVEKTVPLLSKTFMTKK